MLRWMLVLCAASLAMAGCAALSGTAAEEDIVPVQPATKTTFKVIGIGGAGGMFTPSCGPDGKTMLVSCDMSGSYRSVDGGKSWEMIHWRQIGSSRGCRPCFAMGDGEEIYWATGASLRVSKDKGKTWTPVVKGEAPWGREGITHIAAIVEGDNEGESVAFLVVGTASGLWRKGLGRRWEKIADGKCRALCSMRYVAYASVGKKPLLQIARTLNDCEDSDDPAMMFKGLAAGGGVVLAASPSKGVMKSTDDGKTWQLLPGSPKVKDILMASNQTEVAYAVEAGRAKKIWRTRDGGKTWDSCFRMGGGNANVERSWVQTELHWGYYITHLGLGVNLADAKTVTMSTQGDFYKSIDGGESWQQVMNIPVGVKEGDPGYRYKCNGLEVTSCWDYLFDPFERNRRYIAYTDIGFSRSVDSDETWISATRGSPWRNTYYKVICDPKIKGRLYAAASNRHDIPHWTHVDANKGRHAVGGVIVSDNHGASWRVLGKGLPNLPCTCLAMDPATADKPEGQRIFYCTLYEGGVYKSTDGGATWTKKSEGLGNPGNLHCYMIKVHPKTGDVYCSITAHRDGLKFPVPGGIWKSTDGGESWKDISASAKLRWPAGFAIHPEKPEAIYLTAATIPGGREGGVYKTTDGGLTWQRIMKDEDFAATGGASYVHALFINMHPDDPDRVYVGTAGHGLWVTADAGKTWKRFEGIPFRPCQNVTFDPEDTKVMYVTTFGGGIWKGHYMPAE